MLTTSERYWFLAVLAFGLGDAVTTLLGFNVGLVETSPLYQGLETETDPVPVVFGMKIVVFGLAYLSYRYAPRDARIGIPIGLALLGSAVTIYNSALILLLVTA